MSPAERGAFSFLGANTLAFEPPDYRSNARGGITVDLPRPRP